MKKLVAVVCAVAMTLSTVSVAFAHSESPTGGTTVENQTNPNAQQGTTVQPTTPSGQTAPAPQVQPQPQEESASAITVDDTNTDPEVSKAIEEALADGASMSIEPITREELADMKLPAEQATAYSALMTVAEAATNAENYVALLSSALATMNASTDIAIKDEDGNVTESVALTEFSPLVADPFNISLKKGNNKDALLGKVTEDGKIALSFTLPALAGKNKDNIVALQFVMKKGEVPEGESKLELVGTHPKSISERGAVDIELPSVVPFVLLEKPAA